MRISSLHMFFSLNQSHLPTTQFPLINPICSWEHGGSEAKVIYHKSCSREAETEVCSHTCPTPKPLWVKSLCHTVPAWCNFWCERHPDVTYFSTAGQGQGRKKRGSSEQQIQEVYFQFSVVPSPPPTNLIQYWREATHRQTVTLDIQRKVLLPAVGEEL